MTVSLADRFRNLIQGKKWVKGAVNYDEDLHFSTFYLRASHARHTSPLYPGYTSILAFYEGFNETYFLLKDECWRTASAIVTRALRQPNWLPKILRAIRRRSDALTRMFGPETAPDWLACRSDAELLSLYRKHADSQRLLYKYARLPEALDRGDGYFTGYLREYLGKHGLTPMECAETFAVLAQPAVPSVLAQELIDFEDIVRHARAETRLPAGYAQGRARMFLGPQLLARLRAHQEKWKYLHYHGYGRRELASLGHYIERLVEHLDNPEAAGHAAGLCRRTAQAAQERQQVLSKLHLDRAHHALFAIYAEIGAVKLYRRYAQLRNFYFLDMLLAEIAERLGVTEWLLRSMLPEEIMSALKGGRLAASAVQERGTDCMFALLPKREYLLSGTVARELRELFQAKTHSRGNGKVLKGTVACRGHAVGPCKVVIRADDVRQDFARGSIVVSESTDPDLIVFLKHAGAVLTEQGGVTSHAAIICRELGVPTIIGIEGLLDRVRDGDVVEVDAERGRVILPGKGKTPPPGVVFSPAELQKPEVVGAKAHNLGVVRSLGFTVPDYVAVSYQGVKRLLDRASPRSCRQLSRWLLGQLNLPSRGRVALRSSAVSEDRDDGSHAGEFHSLLHIEPDQAAAALDEFVRSNRISKNGTRYCGSILVQRMIAADVAGVCLTLDPRTGNGNTVILELMAGGNEAITQGTVVPERIVVDRLTGDILEDQRRRGTYTSLDVTDLVKQFLTLEGLFGKPVDIEWAWAEHKLYILQVRPIVVKPAALV